MEFIWFILAGVFFLGIILLGCFYIAGLKDELDRYVLYSEKLERDLDWWQNYCDQITEEKKYMLDQHELRLKELDNRIKELEKELDDKDLENLELKKLNFDDTISKPFSMPEGHFEATILHANELRAATKDLDFPPVGKIEEDPTDFWPTNIIKPDAIDKFLNRQSKKEDENNG